MSSGPATILVVSEEAVVVSLFAQVLEIAGYSFVGSSNPEQAITLVESTQPVNMIVLDLPLAALSAVELIRRAGQSRPELRALLLTDGVDPIAGIRKSDPVLLKPFRIAEFTKLVRRTLEEAPPRFAREWARGPERRRSGAET
jgi:CheY-like chemotaxis protein